MQFLYTLLFYGLIPFILVRLLWRSLSIPAYRQRWHERFGWIQPLPSALWVHAVSVGEVQAAIPLVRALQRRFPEQSILITTMTPTGSARVTATFGTQVHHVYVPYDLPGAVNRFLHNTQPQLLIVMETELWPHLLQACYRRKIPVVLVNARLSARSMRGYQWFPTLTRQTLAGLRVIAAQSAVDADRFIQLGAPAHRVMVTGSIKFDLEIPADVISKGQQLRATWDASRPVWIAASTHEGEEEQILDAFAHIRKTLPSVLLILVPRHPERFERVSALCHSQGYPVIRRSNRQATCTTDTMIYLGDTMGELLLLYAASDVAFVGGSLLPIGGHNPLEPAALGIPMVFGTHMFNFADISHRLCERQIAQSVSNVDELVTTILRLLMQPSLRQQRGEHARQFIDENRGALQKVLDVIARENPLSKS